MTNSRGKFTIFIRSVPKQRIDYESLNEYFYRNQDDNGKDMLDTIAGGLYGECTFQEIVEKVERISQNNKAWSTQRLKTGKNTFEVQATRTQSTDIGEEMA